MFFNKKSPAKQSQFAEQFALDDRILPLKVVQNARAKRLTLRILAGGQGLRVTAPFCVTSEQIDDFLNRHKGWIATKCADLPVIGNEQNLRFGVSIPFLGKPHLIIQGQGRGLTHIDDSDKDNPKIIVYSEEAFVPRRIKDFLMKSAKEIIPPLVEKHGRSIAKQAKTIRYKDTKSRWGSCTSQGDLSFSWRIIMAPYAIVDYLVAHEVAHLQHMNHAPAFWTLCTQLCPRTQTCKSWLKRNGQKLHAIRFD